MSAVSDGQRFAVASCPNIIQMHITDWFNFMLGGEIFILKEKLHNIYKFAESYDDAKLLFERWIKEAQSSNVKNLKALRERSRNFLK